MPKVLARIGWSFAYVIAGIGAILALLAGLVVVYVKFSNHWFARNYFESPPFERVVGSKASHWDVFGCSYAIVEVGTDAAALLAARGPGAVVRAQKGRGYKWPAPDRWRPTPFRRAPGEWNAASYHFAAGRTNGADDGHFAACLNEFAPNDRATILAAVDAPGGWFHVQSETVLLVLPQARMIGEIRFGD